MIALHAVVDLIRTGYTDLCKLVFYIYYDQKQGLFIGAPNSPCFAEIYIQRVEENHVYTILNAPPLWYRKGDKLHLLVLKFW